MKLPHKGTVTSCHWRKTSSMLRLFFAIFAIGCVGVTVYVGTSYKTQRPLFVKDNGPSRLRTSQLGESNVDYKLLYENLQEKVLQREATRDQTSDEEDEIEDNGNKTNVKVPSGTTNSEKTEANSAKDEVVEDSDKNPGETSPKPSIVTKIVEKIKHVIHTKISYKSPSKSASARFGKKSVDDKAKILQDTFAAVGCANKPLSQEMLNYWGGGGNAQLTEKEVVWDMYLYCKAVMTGRNTKRQLEICGRKPNQCNKIQDLVHEASADPESDLPPYDIGGNFEAFVDLKLISHLNEATIKATIATPREIIFSDNPKSSGIQNYFSFLQDNLDKNLVHMYYRCDPVGKIKEDGNDGAYCYARSEDGGRTFKKPAIHKKTNSNKMAFDDGIHAFSAFIDPRPGIPKEERYKGIGVFNERYSSGGWVAFTSSDGVNYSQVPDTHLFIRQKFLKRMARNTSMPLTR